MKTIRIYRWGLHMGEERLVEGNHNSGMINFSGCHLACNFCYTPETSVNGEGTDYSPEAFYELLEWMVNSGARNINLISPTHVWTMIGRELLRLKMRYGSLLPLVLKVSGYESPNLARSFEFADVIVPDFKVFSAETATRVHLPADYGMVAQRALAILQKSHPAEWTPEGKLRRGILVRHLLMPGAEADSSAVVAALAEIGFKGPLNLMTRFVDPAQRKLHQAPSERVEALATQATASGITVLIDGKMHVPIPLKRRSYVRA